MNVYGLPCHQNMKILLQRTHDYSVRSLSTRGFTSSNGKQRLPFQIPSSSQGCRQSQPLECQPKKVSSSIKDSIKIVGRNTTIKKQPSLQNNRKISVREEHVLGNFIQSLVENSHGYKITGGILLENSRRSLNSFKSSEKVQINSKNNSTPQKLNYTKSSILNHSRKGDRMSIETMKQKYQQLFKTPYFPVKKKSEFSAKKYRDLVIVSNKRKMQCRTPIISGRRTSQNYKTISMKSQESFSSPSFRKVSIYSSHNSSIEKLKSESKPPEFGMQVYPTDLAGQNPYRIQHIQFPDNVFRREKRSRCMHTSSSSRDNRIILELPRMDAL